MFGLEPLTAIGSHVWLGLRWPPAVLCVVGSRVNKSHALKLQGGRKKKIKLPSVCPLSVWLSSFGYRVLLLLLPWLLAAQEQERGVGDRGGRGGLRGFCSASRNPLTPAGQNSDWKQVKDGEEEEEVEGGRQLTWKKLKEVNMEAQCCHPREKNRPCYHVITWLAWVFAL